MHEFASNANIYADKGLLFLSFMSEIYDDSVSFASSRYAKGSWKRVIFPGCAKENITNLHNNRICRYIIRSVLQKFVAYNRRESSSPLKITLFLYI